MGVFSGECRELWVVRVCGPFWDSWFDRGGIVTTDSLLTREQSGNHRARSCGIFGKRTSRSVAGNTEGPGLLSQTCRIQHSYVSRADSFEVEAGEVLEECTRCGTREGKTGIRKKDETGSF